MDLRLSPVRTDYALRVSEYLIALAGPNPQATIDAMVIQDLGGNVNSLYREESPVEPRWYVANANAWGIVLISGCSLLDHAVQTMQGYAGGLTSPVEQPVNAYFQSIAQRVYDRMRDDGLFGRPNILIAGHSLGGAVTEVLVGATYHYRKTGDVTSVTFGACKPGSRDLNRLLTNSRRVRWMATDDPVPLLPPTPEDTLSVYAVYPVLAVARFNNFVQPSGGMSISPLANISPAVLPVDAQMNAAGSLAGWLLAVDGSSSSAHHLTSYRNRFAANIAQQDQRFTRLPEPAPAEEVERLPAAEMTRQQRETVAVLNEVSAEQRRVKLAIPPASLFSVHRVGKLYEIRFNGGVVGIHTRRKSALKLAREFNEALRFLQLSPLVNVEELQARLTTYFNKATLAGQGFTPTMKKALPGE